MTKPFTFDSRKRTRALLVVLSLFTTAIVSAADLAAPVKLLLAGVKSVSVADLNGDGRNDIIARTRIETTDVFGGRAATDSLHIYLNQGKGSFAPPQLIWSKIAKAPNGFANYDLGCSDPIVGDFNGDGAIDIAVATARGTTSVFLNNTGDFSQRIDTPQGLSCKSFPVDIDNDGRLDILSSDGILLRGRGNGQFSMLNIPSERQPRETIIAVGDFDNDGRIDLIVADDELIEFWRGKPDGSFSALRGANTGLRVDLMPSAVASTDVNADGFLDIVLTDFDTLSIFLGRGDGTFGTRISPKQDGNFDSEFYRNTRNISTADLNLDGRSDIVLVSTFAVAFLGLDDPRLAKVEGVFSWMPAGVFLYGQALYSTMGDVDGDGKPDLLIAKTGFLDGTGQRADRIEIYFNTINLSRNPTECLFNWAERFYPTLFPSPGTTSGAWGTYYYRHYPQSNSFLATSPSQSLVYYLGPISNNAILSVGSVPSWLATSGCR